MKFGKTLDYSMMLTAPLRESLHWKSYKMPRPDRPDVTQPQDVGGAPRGADVGPGDGGGPPDVAQHLQRVRHGDRGPLAARSQRGAEHASHKNLVLVTQFTKGDRSDRGIGQGDAVGRLLGSLEDLGKAAAGSGSTPTSQEHLVLLLKFRYLVLVIYAMFSIVQSCLVFGRGM